MTATGSRYHEVYQSWKKDPEAFWGEAARDVDWYKLWDDVFDPYSGQYGHWFPGAECNTAYNCLDRHVEAGRGDQAALIYDSPVTGTTKTYTYSELTDEVATLSAVLVDVGVKPGDRVIIYMPMIAEAVMAMLACARIGAVHSVVFGGFAASELATRIDDAKPVAIMSASCGIEGAKVIAYKPLLDKAIELAKTKPSACIVLQRPQAEASMIAGRDYDWAEVVGLTKSRGRKAGPVAVKATDPLYVLYTSGTTGQPKGVVRDNGGHMVALKWTMKNFYNIDPGEVFWAASDVGWVVGHSYIAYAPLLHGATTLVYEGKPVGTPDAGAFWRVISQHKVVSLFTAPTAFRAIKKEDPDGSLIGKYDLSCLRALFLAGERADPETLKWAEEKLKVPVIDHWWQTETGWCIAGNPVGLGLLPVKHGSPTVAMPGFELHVLDDNGKRLGANEQGTIAIPLPMPPGCLPTLWGNDKRFRESYLTQFEGYYSTSDAGYLDEDGYVYVMARTDDVINVAGHRLSTGQMEEVVARHPDVAECAVIGVADALKGQLPAGFLVLNAGVARDHKEIENEVVSLVRNDIGPVAAFKNVMVVQRLPKTRSGKILRATMRKIADGEPWTTPATIDDPAILEEIKGVLAGRGMGA
ncbi:MAG: propionate--CoA ligase [Alphaproteobacteria bacterium BRH_c36]|nr:MAG: propionate--CoA ligase [Alphaproteobacteria bacterium BRH_c36]